MTDTIELFLPCELFDVKVAVAPTNVVTEVERYVLRALNDPAIHSLDALTDLFGLGYRPTLDIVLGLWRHGYVEVEEPGSVLRLSEVSKGYLERSKLNELPAGTEVIQRNERVMRERVSGHFIEVQPRASLVVTSRTAPALQPVGLVSEDGRRELRMLLAGRNRKSYYGRTEHLVASYLPVPDGGPIATKPRTIRVLARVWKDATSDRTRFDIIHPTNIPTLVRRDIGATLSSLSIERPGEIFFKQIDELARRSGQSDLDLEEAMEHLEARVAAMGRIQPGNAPKLHEECDALAENIESLLDELDGHEVAVEALAGADAIVDAIVRAIKSTERQLVLVCPFLHVRGYQRFRDALTTLLDQRPVHVFLIWGVEQDARLSEPMQLALETMQKSARLGRLHFVEVPARTHAKLVVKDADWALVTSFNYLNWQDDPLAEVGIAVGATEAGPTSFAIDMLRWVAKAFPDYSLGRLIRTGLGDFGGDDEPKNSVNLPTERPTVPMARGSKLGHVSVEIWQAAWVKHAAELRALVDGRHLTSRRVRMIEDEDHRLWLWRALDGCKNRLLIASDALADDVVDDRFLYTLRKRLEEGSGPDVTLLYHRSRDVSQLQRLEENFSERLHLIQGYSHAKVLAWDDRALVSSFNFLSFEGVYRGHHRRRVRSEVGVPA